MRQSILLQGLFVVAFKDHNMVSCLFSNANKLIIRSYIFEIMREDYLNKE